MADLERRAKFLEAGEPWRSSPEHKEEAGARLKRLWKERRQEMSKALSETWTPERKAAFGEVSKRRNARPDMQEKLRQYNEQRWSDPAERERMSQLTKADPLMKERVRKATRARWSDPENRKAQSEGNRRRWADPAYKERVTQSLKRSITPEVKAKRDRYWNDPASRNAAGERARLRWTDPAYKERYRLGKLFDRLMNTDHSAEHRRNAA